MKIATIIPAYNEEMRIGNVIEVVKKVNVIDEIIVVDDGSEDATYDASSKMGVNVIRLSENKGKGAAIMEGVNSTQADLLVLLDADLVGLTSQHILDLLEPVIHEKCEMSYGIFSNGRVATDLAQKVAPFLTGQRVVKREILINIGCLEITRFGVEVALTRYFKKNNLASVGVPMSNITHVMKEEKLGFIKGFGARLKMYWEIVKAFKIS